MYYKLEAPGMRLQNAARVSDLHGGGDLPIKPRAGAANPISISHSHIFKCF